jgi:hypothetical protein
MPDPPEPSRRSSRAHVPKIRLAESDDDNTSIDTPPSKTTINKRKSNDDNNNSSKAAKTTTTTTTHTSITTEADKIKNKALFNKFNSSMSIVNNVGDVGYEFNKLFEDGNSYAGFVTEIRPGAAGGKDRRCVYEDGDLEDLSMEELESFASNTDDTNNNNSTSADGTSTSISTALKFNNKTGDERTTTGAVNNNMEVDKVNNNMEVDKVNNNMEVDKVNDSADVEMNEGRDELLSGSAAVPTTTPPEESSIGISGTSGSTLTVTLTVESSIAERGGDTSCAATANNSSSVKNVDSTTTTKDKGNRRVSIGYKADSDAAIADMVERKDWSQTVRDDKWAKPSKDGKVVNCAACWGKKNARTGGVQTMRRPFDDHRWIDHTKTTTHIANVAQPAYQSTSMLSFFKTVPKKNDKPSE